MRLYNVLVTMCVIFKFIVLSYSFNRCDIQLWRKTLMEHLPANDAEISPGQKSILAEVEQTIERMLKNRGSPLINCEILNKYSDNLVPDASSMIMDLVSKGSEGRRGSADINRERDVRDVKSDKDGLGVKSDKYGRDVNKDGRDVNKDGRDVNKDGSDVNKDGRDVNKDGRDVNKDGRDVNSDKDGRDVNSDKDGRDVNKDGRDVKSDKDGRDVNKDGRDVNSDKGGRDVNSDKDGRDVNSDKDGRDVNSDKDGRDVNSDKDGRDVNSDKDGRDVNSDKDGRDVKSDKDGRDVNKDGRDVNSDNDGRDVNSDKNGRDVNSDKDGRDVNSDKDGRDVNSDKDGRGVNKDGHHTNRDKYNLVTNREKGDIYVKIDKDGVDKNKDKDDIDANIDKDDVDANIDKDRTYTNRDTHGSDTNRDKYRTGANRNKDRTGANRDKDDIDTRRDKDDIDTRRDKDDIDTRRDKDDIDTRRDKDDIDTRRDKDDIDTRRDKDDIDTRRYKYDMDTRRDKDDIDTRRDKDDIDTHRDKGDNDTHRDKDDIDTHRDKDDIDTHTDKDGIDTHRDKGKIDTHRDKDDIDTHRDKDDLDTHRDKDDLDTNRDKDDIDTPRDKDDIDAQRNKDDVDIHREYSEHDGHEETGDDDDNSEDEDCYYRSGGDFVCQRVTRNHGNSHEHVTRSNPIRGSYDGHDTHAHNGIYRSDVHVDNVDREDENSRDVHVDNVDREDENSRDVHVDNVDREDENSRDVHVDNVDREDESNDDVPIHSVDRDDENSDDVPNHNLDRDDENRRSANIKKIIMSVDDVGLINSDAKNRHDNNHLFKSKTARNKDDNGDDAATIYNNNNNIRKNDKNDDSGGVMIFYDDDESDDDEISDETNNNKNELGGEKFDDREVNKRNKQHDGIDNYHSIMPRSGDDIVNDIDHDAKVDNSADEIHSKIELNSNMRSGNYRSHFAERNTKEGNRVPNVHSERSYKNEHPKTIYNSKEKKLEENNKFDDMSNKDVDEEMTDNLKDPFIEQKAPDYLSNRDDSTLKMEKLKQMFAQRQSEQAEKIQNLEILLVKLENKILTQSVDKQSDSSTFIHLENQILKLENELMKLSHNYRKLQEDHDSLKAQQKTSYMELEHFRTTTRKSEYPALSDNSSNEIMMKQQTRILELSKLIQNQSDIAEKLQSRSEYLEDQNRKLFHVLMNQTSLIASIMGKLHDLGEEGLQTRIQAEDFKAKLENLKQKKTKAFKQPLSQENTQQDQAMQQEVADIFNFATDSSVKIISPTASKDLVTNILSTITKSLTVGSPSLRRFNTWRCSGLNSPRLCIFNCLIISNCTPFNDIQWTPCKPAKNSLILESKHAIIHQDSSSSKVNMAAGEQIPNVQTYKPLKPRSSDEITQREDDQNYDVVRARDSKLEHEKMVTVPLIEERYKEEDVDKSDFDEDEIKSETKRDSERMSVFLPKSNNKQIGKSGDDYKRFVRSGDEEERLVKSGDEDEGLVKSRDEGLVKSRDEGLVKSGDDEEGLVKSDEDEGLVKYRNEEGFVRWRGEEQRLVKSGDEDKGLVKSGNEGGGLIRSGEEGPVRSGDKNKGIVRLGDIVEGLVRLSDNEEGRFRSNDKEEELVISGDKEEGLVRMSKSSNDYSQLIKNGGTVDNDSTNEFGKNAKKVNNCDKSDSNKSNRIVPERADGEICPKSYANEDKSILSSDSVLVKKDTIYQWLPLGTEQMLSSTTGDENTVSSRESQEKSQNNKNEFRASKSQVGVSTADITVDGEPSKSGGENSEHQTNVEHATRGTGDELKAQEKLLNDRDIKGRKVAAGEAMKMHEALHRKVLYSPVHKDRPKDCYELYKRGQERNGFSQIFVNGMNVYASVYCDMTNGGWTLLLKREDGLVDFYRDYKQYKDGFGASRGEHYIGNDVIHHLTNQGHYSLKAELTDWDDTTKHTLYDHFWVDGEEDGFRLHLLGYSGDAGDGLGKHNGMKFSTFDVDQDVLKSEMGGNCAKRFHGAGWYYNCYMSNLLGRYYPGGQIPNKLFDGVAWKPWLGPGYSLKTAVLAIRPFGVETQS